MRMATIEINAGVYDKGIFKAVILAGGPGSGKSYMSKRLTSGSGLKIVDVDKVFEYLCKKLGLDLSQFANSEEDLDTATKVRKVARRMNYNKLNQFINGRLGVVIDGTGKDYEKIKDLKEQLDSIGYDVMMILINTPLEVAKERNQNRDRKEPDEFVERAWKKVQHNIGKFNMLFKDKFMIVDNKTIDEYNIAQVWKLIKKFVDTPITNPIAKGWIDTELEKRKR